MFFIKLLRVMRITAIIMLVCSLHVSGRTVSQTITFSGKNVSLREVFKTIENQTDFGIVYDNSWLTDTKSITLEVVNLPIKEFLLEAFKDQPLKFDIKDKTIVVKRNIKTADPGSRVPSLFPAIPPIKISGTVVGPGNQPLAGATIRIRGKNITIVSDEKGYFELVAEAGSVLLVSYVGYQQREVKVIDNKPVQIELLSANTNLDTTEVVINTGYQKLKPNEAVGSYTVIDNKTLNLQVGSRILDRLNGVAAGILFPKGKIDGSELMIRGLSTINGPKAPLIILNDFPYEGDINNINPNDIENVTILKDAAATSIWGARAGNGVIVITTKKGKRNAPLAIAINANTTFIENPNLFYSPQISSKDYIELEQSLYDKGYYGDLINRQDFPALSPVVEIMIKKNSGELTQSQAQEALDHLKTVDSRKEYNKDFTRLGINQQYALSATGGTDKLNYTFFGGYDLNISSRQEHFKRINFSFQNEYQVSKRLTVSLGALYANIQESSGAPVLSNLRVGNSSYIPYLSFSDEEGNPLPLANSTRLGFIDTLGGGQLLDGRYYPLTDWKHNTTKTTQNDLTANVGLNFEILKGVSLNLKYLYEQQRNETKNLADVYSYSTRSLINLFTLLDRQTGDVQYIVPMGGVMNKNFATLQSKSFRSQLNIDKRFNKHRIISILGFEARDINAESENHIFYGYDDNNLTFTMVDVVDPQPTYWGFESYIPDETGLKETRNRFVSLFGNAVYTFNSKYTFSISGRRDASNLFGVNINNKWKPLWSTGVSWDIAKELFYRYKALPILKLRATYGYSGNVNQNMAAVTTLAINSGIQYTNLPYATVTNYANPALRWEKVRTFNIGIDFGTIKNRLSGSIEMYQKYATDLYGSELLDYTVGLRQQVLIKNVASMKANGIDISLRSQNIDRRFKWWTNLLFSYYNDKITNYYTPPKGAFGYLRNGNVVNSIVGLPVYSIISYKWGGLDPTNGDPRGFYNDELSIDYKGITNSRAQKGFGDLKNIMAYDGSALPKFYGSLINNFSYGGISISVGVSYRLGYYFRHTSLNYETLFSIGAYPGSGDFASRWQQAGDEQETNVPSLVYPLVSGRDNFYMNSSATVLRADHIRLQFVNLSYDLLLRKPGNNERVGMQIFINIGNVGLLWKANKKNIDPDYDVDIPQPRTWTIGLRTNL